LKAFEIELAKVKPLTMEELQILKYDYSSKKSLYRAMHLLDVHLARKEHSIKADKISIYIPEKTIE
jgi:hypothetical protein